LTPTELAAELKKVREKTDKPFGVDILAPFTKDYEKVLSRFADVIIQGGAKALITGLGISKDVLEKCHRAGLFFEIYLFQ